MEVEKIQFPAQVVNIKATGIALMLVHNALSSIVRMEPVTYVQLDFKYIMVFAFNWQITFKQMELLLLGRRIIADQ